jgi:pilus assembly protein CpaB
MRAKSLVLLMLALGCGIVASVGITQVMSNRTTEPAAAQAETEQIFVAMKDIPMGDPVSAQAIKLEEWPKGKAPQGAITKLEDIENRRPKSRIFAGSPILENQLLGKGATDQGASDSIPKGSRVVAVKVDAVSGSASLIRPGDRVDVLLYVTQCGSGGASRTVTRTILQDIKVFAVNEVWDAAATNGEKSIAAKTISLLVTPTQAATVTMASEMGQIRLVMRSPEDKEQTKVRGILAHDVLGDDLAGLEGKVTPGAPQLQTGQSKPSAVTGLLNLLDANKKKSASGQGGVKSPPELKPPETFTMRILSGPQISDTVLESTGDGAASGPTDASFIHWRVSSSSPSGAALPAPGKPAAGGSGAPSPEEPAPEDDGDEEKVKGQELSK